MFGLYTRKEVERREWERDRERWTDERFERLEHRVWVLEKKLSKLTGESNPDMDCGCVPVLGPEEDFA
ncbi:MAG: hypothetical protein J6Y20_08815 [Lachnospiraceae bacterium]|nr:hypothetical protein [Lachnospiraceae bacterium]